MFLFLLGRHSVLEGAWDKQTNSGYGHQLLSHSDTFDLVFATWPWINLYKPAVVP